MHNTHNTQQVYWRVMCVAHNVRQMDNTHNQQKNEGHMTIVEKRAGFVEHAKYASQYKVYWG